MLAGCDQSPPAGSSSKPQDTVTVQTAAGGAAEQVDLTEATDQAVVDGATQQISTAGYNCTAVSHLWRLEFKANVGMSILKARCSDGADYQITIFNGKGFVKPWTGVLMGN